MSAFAINISLNSFTHLTNNCISQNSFVYPFLITILSYIQFLQRICTWDLHSGLYIWECLKLLGSVDQKTYQRHELKMEIKLNMEGEGEMSEIREFCPEEYRFHSFSTLKIRCFQYSRAICSLEIYLIMLQNDGFSRWKVGFIFIFVRDCLIS